MHAWGIERACTGNQGVHENRFRVQKPRPKRLGSNPVTCTWRTCELGGDTTQGLGFRGLIRGLVKSHQGLAHASKVTAAARTSRTGTNSASKRGFQPKSLSPKCRALSPADDGLGELGGDDVGAWRHLPQHAERQPLLPAPAAAPVDAWALRHEVGWPYIGRARPRAGPGPCPDYGARPMSHAARA